MEDGRPYWHNPDLNLSTWEDPMFILSVFKQNHLKNSLEMIPHSWQNIEGTPFIEVAMKNGKKLYIHRTFRRVFDENPLMNRQEVGDLNDKMQRDKEMKERIRLSKLKRRQMKEKAKEQEENEANEEPEVISSKNIIIGSTRITTGARRGRGGSCSST